MGSDSLGNRAAFVDRDGVINYNWFNPATNEWESPIRADDFMLIPGALDALSALRSSGYHLILVSNQPSAAKGKCSLADLDSVHERFVAELDKAGISFTEFCYAYAHPHATDPERYGPLKARKPSPYFLERSFIRHGLEIAECWMIGDRETDIQCGRSAGVRTIRVVSPDSHADAERSGDAHFHAANLIEAARIIAVQSAPHSR